MCKSWGHWGSGGVAPGSRSLGTELSWVRRVTQLDVLSQGERPSHRLNRIFALGKRQISCTHRKLKHDFPVLYFKKMVLQTVCWNWSKLENIFSTDFPAETRGFIITTSYIRAFLDCEYWHYSHVVSNAVTWTSASTLRYSLKERQVFAYRTKNW
jgi:hypothetical protein